MDERARANHWIDGRIVDDAPRPAGSPWLWLAAVLSLVLAIDLALGFGPAPLASTPAAETGDIRAQLLAAREAADAGRPALLLVGDSVLAGEVLAASDPNWQSQRVIDHMRAELGLHSDAELRQVAFDGLLPIDALHVLAELDRIDPAGRVQFVLELNLRYFSRHYAAQRKCTRPQLCELGRGLLARSGPSRAWSGVVEGAGILRDWLRERAPIHRHRRQLEQPLLAELDGLAIAGTQASEQPRAQAEGLARVQAHYRDASLADQHAQVEALIEIVERLRARGRPSALFSTPLADEFAATTLPDNQLGYRYQQLAALIHEHGLEPPGSQRRSSIEFLDLDVPLFGSEYFLDHVHLDGEGNRLLALNLLHELGLPLRHRPYDWMMVHSEDHDRTLVHRRALGFADGGAQMALFRAPEGVAVSPSGDWIVIADTGNHVLRQLRGSMQMVERLAGSPRKPGYRDGIADQALLVQPRSPKIIGEAVYFLDGKGTRVRRLAHGAVDTVTWSGSNSNCKRYAELEVRLVDDRPQLFLLCADDRVLKVDPHAHTAELVFDARESLQLSLRGLEPTNDGRLLLADQRSRIWSVQLDDPARRPKLVFANAGAELLPQEFQNTYPFSFEEQRLNRIVGMEWVDRYQALLVQDEHDLGRPHARLQREQTERVHLRLLDLDAGLIYPWTKAIPHAEAFHMWNEVAQNLASYFHFGAMAIVQDDASLVYLERTRSRLVRIADGLLAAAKSGNLHTTWSKVELLQPISNASAVAISATMRPDRYLDQRHEPIPRAGPYVALQVSSSLSAISDRLGNYSLARLLELELQAELGYRDGVRLDLYQRVHSSASFKAVGSAFEDFLTSNGPPPDIVLIELHDFQRRYFRHTQTREQRLAQLGQLEQLAARYDTLLIFYDNSAMIADKRDGLRASSSALQQLITDIRKLGFVVIEPSDQLLRELLVESPWGNQPWGSGFHHGAPWALELTAKALAREAYPLIREFLRGRTPARQRERDPSSFVSAMQASLDGAFANTEGLVDRDALPELRGSYVQHQYQNRELELLVDLAGAGKLGRELADYEALALAVLYAELEAYGQLTERVNIELLAFKNYDEYGEGVHESAAVAWRASLDKAELEALIRRVAARQAEAR